MPASRFDTPTQSLTIADDADLPTSLTPEQELVVNLAWLKFENLFDSESGGPRLQDISPNLFDPYRAALLIPYALDRINYTNPMTNFDAVSFPYATDPGILAESLVIEMITHLIRSYVEQWLPTGSGNITYNQRRDFLDRWQTELKVKTGNR